MGDAGTSFSNQESFSCSKGKNSKLSNVRNHLFKAKPKTGSNFENAAELYQHIGEEINSIQSLDELPPHQVDKPQGKPAMRPVQREEQKEQPPAARNN